MLAPFGITEYNNDGKMSYQLCLSFSSMTNLYNEDDIKNFYNFMKKIDRVNEDTILEHRDKWELPNKMKYKKSVHRTSKDYPHQINLRLPHNENTGFLFDVYNDKAEKSTIDIIERRSIVSVALELTDLKFTDKDFKPTWTVLQIRKFKSYSPIQEFFMSGCFICDDDDPEDLAYSNLINKYRKQLETPINLPRYPQLNPAYYQYNPYMSHMYNSSPDASNQLPLPRSMPPPPPPHLVPGSLGPPLPSSLGPPGPPGLPGLPPPPPPPLLNVRPSFAPTLSELTNKMKSLKKITINKDKKEEEDKIEDKTEDKATDTDNNEVTNTILPPIVPIRRPVPPSLSKKNSVQNIVVESKKLSDAPVFTKYMNHMIHIENMDKRRSKMVTDNNI